MRKNRLLWYSIIIFWILGDLATTYYGIHIGLAENNPFAKQIIHNQGFIIFGKLSSTAFVFLHYKVAKTRFDRLYFPYYLPITLLTLGISATFWNTYLIIF